MEIRHASTQGPCWQSSELVRNRIDISSNADLVAHLMAEVGRYSTEKQKVMEHSASLDPDAFAFF
ncbi:MAG: hypothetical protein AUH71_02710 [Thaumarchaeota archaeon 13_1_40CM_4_48_7]|nr:MAG: hypothetical protein AUH71_02710 [Thaumarchaeota archaeon 13_1_40CM_4_48_7]